MSDTKTIHDRVRFAVHDILVHLHETWDAFSKAARQMNMTPEQAEASLISKAVEEIKEEPESDEEKIGNYLKTSFVLSAAGLLPAELEERLGSMCDPATTNWKDAVATDLGVNEEFVRKVHAACVETMPPESAVHFILRGLRVVPSIDALAHAARAASQNAPKPRRRER